MGDVLESTVHDGVQNNLRRGEKRVRRGEKRVRRGITQRNKY